MSAMLDCLWWALLIQESPRKQILSPTEWRRKVMTKKSKTYSVLLTEMTKDMLTFLSQFPI